VLVELGHVVRAERQFRHAGPAGVEGELGAVLLRVEADRGRLHAQRQVLRHHRHGDTVVREVGGAGEDARVVVAELQSAGQHRRARVVELHPQRTAVADRDREVQPLVLDAQLVEDPQRLAREVPDLGVVPLRLELRDDDDWKDHRVLGEAEQRPGIREEHRGVEHVRPLGLCGARGRRGIRAHLATR
jgi:hypothetical protein